MTDRFRWTHRDVQEALGTRGGEEDLSTTYTGVSTDSRALTAGDLFVALVGDRFDGHRFVRAATERGARGVVVSRPVEVPPSIRTYEVADTLVALGALARYRRRRHSARVVGITGSSGKTTTKELTRAALSGRHRVHATAGNLNNRIGLPLTILSCPDEVDVLVLEMGTNEPGEIAALTAIAEPGIGVVTTVSEAHLEKLASREGVFREKLALLEGLPADGRAVVGDDPPDLPPRARALRPDVLVAGWTDGADPDLRPVDPAPEADGCYRFRWRGHPVRLSIPGRHSVVDALLALTVSSLLDVPPEAAAREVSGVAPTGMRGESLTLGEVRVIMDCYNANPHSVRAALDLLEEVPASRRVAVLGTMLELGVGAPELHAGVLEDALARPLDLVVALGDFAAAARALPEPVDGGRLIAAPDVESGWALLRERLRGDEVVLLKASRGFALEGIVPLMEADLGEAGREG